MIKPTVWIETGIVVIYGANMDAAAHSHQAIQLVWPNEGARFQLDDEELNGTLIINSNVEHRLLLPSGWVLLIEPKSALGAELLNKLGNKPYLCLGGEYQGQAPQKKDDPYAALAPLFKLLKIQTFVFHSNVISVKDLRIATLLNELDTCFEQGGIEPSLWSAANTAQKVSLSESRFLHLFRKELGMPWRPYLLWRRILCAVKALSKNVSATEAAHLAGFSDSSHLSRTFRRHFGMSIRQALTLFQSPR